MVSKERKGLDLRRLTLPSVTTLECPSDCLQMSGENLSNEEDNFLLWPLSPGIPAEKPSTSTIEKQPLQPTARLIAYSPKPFQYSKNPPKRDFATFPDQSISERAIRGHEERTLPTKSPDSSAVGWFGPSPKRHNFSYQSRVGRNIDLLSPPESSYSWERQDQPQQHEMRSENYQSHANKQSAPSYQPTESMRRFSSPLPLLDTENSTRQQARTFSFEDSQAVQIQMNRSRPGHHRRTHTETEISSLDNQHRGLEPPNSRFPQSLQTRCNCLPQLLESLSKTDTLLLARDLLSACEASMRCKSCSNSDLALLQRLIGLQKVYSCLYLLREGEKRYPLTRSSKSGFQYRHNHKQEDQASAMRSTKRFTGLASFDEERNEGGRDMELEGGRNPPGEEEDEKHLAENCKSDVAEAVRMLVIRAVTMVSQEEMLSISRGPRAGDMPSVEENSTLTFGSQISILLKNFRALLGLES